MKLFSINILYKGESEASLLKVIIITKQPIHLLFYFFTLHSPARYLVDWLKAMKTKIVINLKTKRKGITNI